MNGYKIKNNKGGQMSSEKQLLLIIIAATVVGLWQLYQEHKQKKYDEKLQRHLSKYFDSKW
jgi:phosphomannomutase